MMPDNKSTKSYKLMLLAVLVLAGIMLYQSGFFEDRFFQGIEDQYISNWWFAPLIIAAKAVFYAFALPGSIFYVPAGIFFNPFYATLIIASGGVLGAVGAYFFSRFISRESRGRIRSSKAFAAIQKHGNFSMLSAVRILPGFPHSVINYGSGILNIPLPMFIATALIGFFIKGFLYASAIHRAARTDGFEKTGIMELTIPLAGLALLFILGGILRRKLRD